MPDVSLFNLTLAITGAALAFFSIIALLAWVVLWFAFPRGKENTQQAAEFRPKFHIREDDPD